MIDEYLSIEYPIDRLKFALVHRDFLFLILEDELRYYDVNLFNCDDSYSTGIYIRDPKNFHNFKDYNFVCKCIQKASILFLPMTMDRFIQHIHSGRIEIIERSNHEKIL